MKRFLLASLLGLVLGSWPAPVRAAPQGHGALAAGPCAQYRDAGDPAFPKFCGALRAELLLGRQRDRDFGAGPMLSLSTVGFDHFGVSAGASLLVPLSPTYPFVVTIAGGAQSHDAGFVPALEGWLFWGPTSYNFHSNYAMASGLLLGVQHGLGQEGVSVVSLSGQLDLALVAIPFIALHQWALGGE